MFYLIYSLLFFNDDEHQDKAKANTIANRRMINVMKSTPGLIYCAGQAMLVYRSCRCCRRIWNKVPYDHQQYQSKAKRNIIIVVMI